MAYAPDDICSSMEMFILNEELKRKEKSKKNKDEDTIFDHLTFESGIFLGMVIGMVMTLVIVVIMIKLF